MKDLFGHEAPALLPPDGEKGQEERGAFYTPDALALAICRTLKGLGIAPGSIFEPGCGGGSFLRAANAAWPSASVLGVDLVPACDGPGVVLQQDLFKVKGPFDLVLGNPDFAIAEAVVRHGLSVLNPGGYLAFLLLASFEESKDRIAFWQEHPLWVRQAVGFPRPCFRADGQSDMRPYSLFVWKAGEKPERYQGLRPLVWKDELERRQPVRRRRRRKAAVRPPPPHWRPQFQSEADWRSWCERDAASERFEMSEHLLPRAA